MIVKTEAKQTTINEKVSLIGVGLHTGQEVTINFLPAEPNDGYKFRRLDLEGLPMINADVNLVTNTQRGTCLEKNGVTIQTCEHVQSFPKSQQLFTLEKKSETGGLLWVRYVAESTICRCKSLRLQA